MKTLLHLSAVLLLTSACWGQFRGGDDYRATIWPIQSVLHNRHVSASLEYWGSCPEHRIPDFPSVTKPSGDSTQPLQALREMFTNDKQMQISQDADGVIRMREADVPRDLLDVKIAHLSFDDQEKKGVPMYDPYFVLSFILGAPEVQAFMKGHGILRRGLLHEITVDPDQRVKGELNNVTLSEALDYMMKTFRGILVHENCPGVGKVDRVVVFAFFQIGQEPATRTARP